MTGGSTFTCEVLEDLAQDAVFFTLSGIMHSGPSEHYDRLKAALEAQLAKPKLVTRFVVVIDQLRHISNNGADLIVSLASGMKRPDVRGIVILQGLSDQHMAIYRTTGRAPQAFFALSQSVEETKRLLDEHKRVMSGTVQVNDL